MDAIFTWWRKCGEEQSDPREELHTNQAEVLGSRHGVRPSVYTKLHKNVFDMRLHRLRSDPQLPCDLLIRSALADTLENIALARAQ